MSRIIAIGKDPGNCGILHAHYDEAMDAADLLLSVALFATPMLLAAIGELVAERAGIVNIGIEGMMLMGAAAAWVANASGGAATGLLGGVIGAMAMGALFAWVVLKSGADQIVTGAGINLLALGLTGLIHRRFDARIASESLSIINPIHLVWAVPFVAALVWWFLERTRGGLELRAVGESAQAADSAGVNVERIRLNAILFGAACAGLAGAYLSTMRVAGFTENMTEGQGFVALAMVIFGRWNPALVLAAGVFFGAARGAADWIIVARGVRQEIGQLLQVLPYALSLAALVIVRGGSAAPAGLGKNYQRA